MSDSHTHRTIVNVCLVNSQGEILLFERTGTDTGRNFYALPGGRMEITDQNLHAAAIREMREEVGVELTPENLEFAGVCERPPLDARVTTRAMQFIFIARTWQGEPNNMEPLKHSNLAWFSPKNLPAALHEVDCRIIANNYQPRLYVD